MSKKGNFIISLDFELNWGVWDVVSLNQYKPNLDGVQKVIPALLSLFDKYNVQATFATVGFLFFENKEDLINYSPTKKPSYENEKLSPYANQLLHAGKNETEDKLHFAPTLINLIKKYNQEVACHTFCHYYCLENGQTKSEFEADLLAGKLIAEKSNVKLKSIVFPRNQYNKAYIEICKKAGITSYRGNEKSWIYKAVNSGQETLIRRFFRLLDTYINLSGNNCYQDEFMKDDIICNIPSSRFLRPHNTKLALLDNLKLLRIKNSMTYAAKRGQTYHLWWHPHNFGINLEENLIFLEKILIHADILKKTYGFRSISMQNLASELKPNND